MNSPEVNNRTITVISSKGGLDISHQGFQYICEAKTYKSTMEEAFKDVPEVTVVVTLIGNIIDV